MPDSSRPDYAAFLAQHLPTQSGRLARYAMDDGSCVWLRRPWATPHPVQGTLWGWATRLARTPALRPLIPLEGSAAIAREAQRLAQFAAQGLRVPAVLAHSEAGLLVSHIGHGTVATDSLFKEMEAAASDPAAMLALWQQGLALMDRVHAAGMFLGSAFARHMVRGPDGALACVDLSEDSGAQLPPHLCQVRDALSYLYDTAMLVHAAGAREAARPLWQAWTAQTLRGEAFRDALKEHLARLSWLRYLPPDARWGHAAWQLRAAYEQATRLRYE